MVLIGIDPYPYSLRYVYSISCCVLTVSYLCICPLTWKSSQPRISEILGEPQASLERLLRESIAPEGSKKEVEAISAEKIQKGGNTYYDTWSFMMFYDFLWFFLMMFYDFLTMFHDVLWCFMIFYYDLWCFMCCLFFFGPVDCGMSGMSSAPKCSKYPMRVSGPQKHPTTNPKYSLRRCLEQ